MTVALRLSDGEFAEGVDLEGEKFALVSPRAFAPGAPVEMTAELAEGELQLVGKSLGSKRRSDGRFDVRVRLINLRREQRQQLHEAL
jgi:hypothetical protein